MRKPQSACFYFCLLLFLAIYLPASAQSTERLLRQAYTYSAKGKWRKAFKKTHAILSKDSLHFDALLLRGDLLLRTNRLSEAYASGRQLTAHYPDSLASWLFFGEVQMSLDSLPQAEQALLRAYTIAPESAELHLQLGILYAQAGIDSTAITHLDYAYEALPESSPLRPEVLFHLGMSALEQNQKEEALGYFNQALQEAPHFYLAYIGKAYCQYLRGKYRESLQLLSLVEKKAPYLLTKEDYVLWAKNLYGLKHRNAAMKVLRLLPEPMPAEGYQLLARMLYESKEYKEALGYLQKAVPLARSSQALSSLFHDQALIYLALQQPREALDSYSRAIYLWYPITQQEKKKEHLGVLQTCLYDADKLLNHHFSKDTLEHIRREQWHELALTLLYEGDAQEAEKVCRQLITRTPTDALAYQYLGMSLLLQNQITKAEDALLKALELSITDSSFVYDLLAEAAIAREALFDAHRYVDQSLKIAPTNPDALHLKGYIHSLAKNYEAAYEWAGRALQYAPEDEDIIKDAMQWAQAAGLCKQALLHANNLINKQVHTIEAWLCKGHCALETGDITQAEYCYQNAAAINKSHPGVPLLHQAIQKVKSQSTAGQ